MITVAIPTMDRPGDLRRCLESVLRGVAGRPAEILVVDQSEGHATRDVVEALAHPAVRHVALRPAGLSRARNHAAARASGRYLAFLDDDADVPPGWLAAAGEALERLGWPEILFGEIVSAESGSPDDLVSSFRIGRETVWRGRVHPSRLGWGGHMIVERAALEHIGGFDERLGLGTDLYCAEDIDFSYRLLRAGGRAVSTPALRLVHHHQQWRDPRALPAAWYRYGKGNGAFYAKHLRRRDPFAAYLLARQVAYDLSELATAVARRSRLRVRVSAYRAAGTWVGVAAGWRQLGGPVR